MRYKIYDGMKKQAGPVDEIASQAIYSSIPYLNAGAGAGNILGWIASPATEEAESRYDRNRGYAWIPGVGGYQLNKRLKRQLKSDKGGTPHFWSQTFGPMTSTLATTGAGAILGGLAGAASNGFKDDTRFLPGMGIGAAVGAGASVLAQAIAALSAAVTDRRTKAQQREYANSSTSKEWLIPGSAMYNTWKTIGRSLGDSEERQEKEDKKQAKIASIQKLAYAAIGQGYTPQYQQYDIGPGYMNVQGGVAPTGSTYQPQYAYANSGYNDNGQRYVAYGNVPSAQYAPPRNVRQPQPQMTPPVQGMPQQPRMRPNSPYMGVNAQGIPTVTAGNVPGYQNKALRVMGGAFAQQQRPAMAAPQPPIQRQMRPNSPYISNNNGVRTVTAGNVPGFQNKAPRNIGGRGVR